MRPTIRARALLCVAFAFVGARADEVYAQPMGLFRWQLAPYCNVVTLGVTQENGLFSVAGFDDQCGGGQRASVVGTAFSNPDGTIGIGLSTVTAPGGSALHVEARISLATLGGPWQDSAGRSGSFVFTPGASTGGPPRPSSHVTRVFQPAQIGWTLVERGIYKYQEAVLSIPEITQAVVDSGIVHVHLSLAPFLPEPWTAAPWVFVIGTFSRSFTYSLDVGKVVLRSQISTNDPVTPTEPVKVLVLP